MINSYRTPDQGLVVVDVGDSIFSKNAAGRHPIVPGDLISAETMIQALGSLDVHAMVPGELELAGGLDWLKKAAARAKVPLLCANLRDRRGRAALTPHRVVDTGGVKVGLLGLVDFSRVHKNHEPILKREKVRATALEAAARAGVKALRQGGAELIVVLGHIDMKQARTLATRVPGIHLLLVGHGGTRVDTPQKAGQTYLVQAGERGREVGHLEIRLSAGWEVSKALTDDTRRYTLFDEATHAARELRASLAAQKPAVRGQGMEATIARVKHLHRKYRELPPAGQGAHLVVSTLVELNGKVPANPTIEGLVRAGARQRAAVTKNNGPRAVRMIPTQVKIK